MKSRYFIPLLLIMSLVIAACGSSEEKPTSNLEAVNEQVVEQDEPLDSVQDETPIGTDFSGQLIYTNANNLYVRDSQAFDEPVLLAESVHPEYMYFSPDMRSIIYGLLPQSDNSGQIIQLTDLQTYENYQLAEFGFNFGSVNWVASAWSPNEEWVVFVGNGYAGVGVAKADGSVTHLVTRQVNNIVGWLTDNRLLIINRTVVNTETRATEIEVFDPAINKREVFSVPDDSSQNTEEIKALINRAGLEPVDPDFLDEASLLDYSPINLNNLSVNTEEDVIYRSRPHADNISRYCGTWEIYQQPTILASNEIPETTVLYAAEDVGALSDVQVLDDGSLTFIEWNFPNCEFLQTPQAKLVHWQTDGTVVILADDLARIADRNQILDSATYRFRRYAIAPDSQSVAWISSSENGRDTQLQIMNLATLERVTVDSVVNQDEGFATVYWLQS